MLLRAVYDGGQSMARRVMEDEHGQPTQSLSATHEREREAPAASTTWMSNAAVSVTGDARVVLAPVSPR